jgi:hypothetical protein
VTRRSNIRFEIAQGREKNHFVHEQERFSAGLDKAVGGAELAVGPGANLLGLVAGVVALVAVAALAVILARVGDGAGVAIVCVDAAEDAAVDSDDVVDDDVARPAVAVAVAAAAGELAVVLDVEVGYGDGADAVDLDDLVVGRECAAARDGQVAVLLEGDGVLADVLPPDIGDGAGALAVDALGLVGANNDVGDGGAVLEDEDGIVGARLALALADDLCGTVLVGGPGMTREWKRDCVIPSRS